MIDKSTQGASADALWAPQVLPSGMAVDGPASRVRAGALLSRRSTSSALMRRGE